MALPSDENRLQPDHLPTPFSASEIRAGCPVGRTIRIQVEAPWGEQTFLQIRFVNADAIGAVQEFQPTDREWRAVGEPTRRNSSWLELQHHASQSASATVIDEVDLESPLGTEQCWRYTTSTAEGSGIFWFAKARPGMPVQVEQWVGGELVSRSVVIADEVG
jgi:hypothetical protein